MVETTLSLNAHFLTVGFLFLCLFFVSLIFLIFYLFFIFKFLLPLLTVTCISLMCFGSILPVCFHISIYLLPQNLSLSLSLSLFFFSFPNDIIFFNISSMVNFPYPIF